jgi:GDPmannose 4,6-dehydratase
MKSALIFGARGQDGTYLTDLLIEKGYKVYAQYRQDQHAGNSVASFPDTLLTRSEFRPIEGTAADPQFTYSVVKDICPDEIYYLASNHELDYSLENYEKSRAINLDGLAGALEALVNVSRPSRLFYASSSNIFYGTSISPQNEKTPHTPNSLYGFFKSASMSLIEMYRKEFGTYACSGILYNHESPRRKDFFLPKKIVSAAVEIKNGGCEKLYIGDIDAVRDWGYAGDFVRAMWMMLQGEYAKDYVIGTGTTHTVEWIINFVFRELGLYWRDHVVIDNTLIRNHDTAILRADNACIKRDLGWKPEIEFEDVLRMMINSELEKSLLKNSK